MMVYGMASCVAGYDGSEKRSPRNSPQQDWGLSRSHTSIAYSGLQLSMKMAMAMADAVHSKGHVSLHGLYRPPSHMHLTLQSILSLSEQLHKSVPSAGVREYACSGLYFVVDPGAGTNVISVLVSTPYVLVDIRFSAPAPAQPS